MSKKTWINMLDAGVILAEKVDAKVIVIFLGQQKDEKLLLAERANRTCDIIGILPTTEDAVVKPATDRASEDLFWGHAHLSRNSRVRYSLLMLSSLKRIAPSGYVMCLLGTEGKTNLDTLYCLRMEQLLGKYPSMLQGARPIKQWSPTLVRVIDIAVEIGLYGREASSVGTSLIVGDTKQVLSHSTQTVLDPFKGYGARDRNIFSDQVVENIKEIAQMDGAFVVGLRGRIVAAGRHLETPKVNMRELRGLGSRHRSAAGITKITNTVAVTVSSSDGLVRVFHKGKMISIFEPRKPRGAFSPDQPGPGR